MHVERTIDADRHTIYTTITGDFTLKEVYDDIARLTALHDYSPDMPGIVDMRNANALLTPEEIRQLTAKIKKSPRTVARTRRALLVGSDRMFNLYTAFAAMAGEGMTDYRVFRDEQEARDWVEEAIAQRRFGKS